MTIAVTCAIVVDRAILDNYNGERALLRFIAFKMYVDKSGTLLTL